MLKLSFSNALNEPRNHILRGILAWPLFYSLRVCMNLQFLPILSEK